MLGTLLHVCLQVLGGKSARTHTHTHIYILNSYYFRYVFKYVYIFNFKKIPMILKILIVVIYFENLK